MEILRITKTFSMLISPSRIARCKDGVAYFVSIVQWLTCTCPVVHTQRASEDRSDSIAKFIFTALVSQGMSDIRCFMSIRIIERQMKSSTKWVLCCPAAFEGDRRDFAFRRVSFRHSHEHQALQISDILIGALAYRLNRHYDQLEANADKKQLCDYILEKTGFERGYGAFQLWFRRHKT